MSGTLPAGRPREIWTRFMVDPLADPLAVRLARSRLVTPNRVTALAMLCALASAACFATGALRVGGALFLVRFFIDCLDGKVARIQGTSSARGAALDLIADVGGIALITAALGWNLVHNGDVASWVPLALLAAMVFYNWALAYRKGLGRMLGIGEGGADHTREIGLPVVRGWVRYCRRVNMSPVPWALEAEIAVLGLAPLLAPRDWLGGALAAGLAFYLVADAVNVRRVWTLARRFDERPASDLRTGTSAS